MASHHDLLDAIARVREATGDANAWQSGLTGEDIAVACNPISSPEAFGAVLAKVVAGHPDVFRTATAPPAPPPRAHEGVAANAIREAETALAQQHSTVAQVDLQVVSAVLNAHAARADGAAELDRLQREIEAAVLSRADLDTPAGAREFQRFLLGKVRDIRAVVDSAGLDATSKAALAAALASLYVSSDPAGEPKPGEPRTEQPAAESDPSARMPSGAPRGKAAADTGTAPVWPPGLADLLESAGFPADAGFPTDSLAPPISGPAPVPISSPAAGLAAAPMPGPAPAPEPAWGSAMPAGIASGLPAGLPMGGGLPPLLSSPPGDMGLGSDPGQWRRGRGDDDIAAALEALDAAAGGDETGLAPEERSLAEPGDPLPEPGDLAAAEPGDSATAARLPGGETVVAPSPELAAAITDAVAGTPIPEAFGRQGIALPPPGSPVSAPLDPSRLAPGDIGFFADRYAVALGNGKALLDQQIQPVAAVTGTGFLGWHQPPIPRPVTTPAIPAPSWPAQTAPS